jgi:cell filamentation protein
MRDIYLYDDCNVLKNLLGIKEQSQLDDAEADYITFRLKELSTNPLKGNYDYHHLLEMHKYIFQDLYEWAGQQRKLNIYKEEPVLGGLSIDYSDLFDIRKDAEKTLYEMRHKEWSRYDIHGSAVEFSDSIAKLWRIHPFREGNTRTTITFCCQYADEIGLKPDRNLFADNAEYVRTALVAYNAVFDDLGDRSEPEYLIRIVEDAISRGHHYRGQ